MATVGLVDLDTPPELMAGGICALRVFAGYAGWGPGQLREEIDQGAWHVLDALPGDAFEPEPGLVFQRVLRRQGGKIALTATFPDDPALN